MTLTRTQLALLAVPLVAVLWLAGSRLAGAGASEGPARQSAVEVARATPAAKQVYVHVVGAVRRPGLLRVRDGARVADAIARAGGPTARADLALVNLAAPVGDGQQVVVPARVAPGGAAAGAAAPAGPVSLSTATVDQLDELPGVGPVTAQKIVDWRASHPIRSVDDLDAIPGIGPARIEQLRELVVP